MRSCLQTLPPVLVIHLKRFDFDWENNRSIKFNDRFEFPRSIDFEPYTVSGLAKRDKQPLISTVLPSDSELSLNLSNPPTGPVSPIDTAPVTPPAQTPAQTTLYDLTGVTVHVGKTSAGHYYSYVKDRASGGWVKFNDSVASPVDMSDAEMEAQFFGGNYTQRSVEGYNSAYFDSRVTERENNAYLLFYEPVQAKSSASPSDSDLMGRMGDTEVLARPPAGLTTASATLSREPVPDRVLEDVIASTLTPDETEVLMIPVLTDKIPLGAGLPSTPLPHDVHTEDFSAVKAKMNQLIPLGAAKYTDCMPPSLARLVQDTNIFFLHQRVIFNADYFAFIRELAESQLVGSDGVVGHGTTPATPDLIVCVTKATACAAAFLFNSFFHTSKKCRAKLACRGNANFLEHMFEKSRYPVYGEGSEGMRWWYEGMRVWRYKGTRVCEYGGMRVYGYKGMRVWGYKSMGV